MDSCVWTLGPHLVGCSLGGNIGKSGKSGLSRRCRWWGEELEDHSCLNSGFLSALWSTELWALGRAVASPPWQTTQQGTAQSGSFLLCQEFVHSNRNITRNYLVAYTYILIHVFMFSILQKTCIRQGLSRQQGHFQHRCRRVGRKVNSTRIKVGWVLNHAASG